MRNLKYLAAAALVASAFGTSVAFAQGDATLDTSQVHPVLLQRAQQLVKDMDPNGTGKVSKETYMRVMESRWNTVIDPNHRGSVSSISMQRRLMFLDK